MNISIENAKKFFLSLKDRVINYAGRERIIKLLRRKTRVFIFRKEEESGDGGRDKNP